MTNPNCLPDFPRLQRRSFCAGLVGAGWTLAAGLGARDALAATDTNVRALAIAYYAPPAQRARLRAALQADAAARLRQWRADGVIANYRVLFNRHADSDVWDATLIIEFPPKGPDERWASLESAYPGALDAQTFASLSAVHTVPIELVRRRSKAPAPRSPVVLAIPYQALVSAGDYLAYADAYAIPQFDGWIREGVLSGYSLWSASFPAARPWTHLLLLEYRSDEALARRDEVVAKVRAELKSDPQWRAISEGKHKVRDEKQPVVAEDLLAAAAP